MIPENIKKLILTRDKADQLIGFSLLIKLVDEETLAGIVYFHCTVIYELSELFEVYRWGKKRYLKGFDNIEDKYPGLNYNDFKVKIK